MPNPSGHLAIVPASCATLSSFSATSSWLRHLVCFMINEECDCVAKQGGVPSQLAHLSLLVVPVLLTVPEPEAAVCSVREGSVYGIRIRHPVSVAAHETRGNAGDIALAPGQRDGLFDRVIYVYICGGHKTMLTPIPCRRSSRQPWMHKKEKSCTGSWQPLRRRRATCPLSKAQECSAACKWLCGTQRGALRGGLFSTPSPVLKGIPRCQRGIASLDYTGWHALLPHTVQRALRRRVQPHDNWRPAIKHGAGTIKLIRADRAPPLTT